MNTPVVPSMLVADLRRRVQCLSPEDACKRQMRGAVLLDVREASEREQGFPAEALGLSRGYLELKVSQLVADKSTPVMTICQSGVRSLLAADSLKKLGYRHVFSVDGGVLAWQQAGLPWVRHDGLDADLKTRYMRQMALPEVGKAGQKKLEAARVAMVGAGGLGAAAALYLAAAGVGHITLIDDDKVELSNLHRQVCHADARVGIAKTESARLAMAGINPRISITTHTQRLMANNVEALLDGHDLIFDGADNFPARYLLTAASQQLGIPVVYGAVDTFSGQVSVFDPRREDSPCYRCLVPFPPEAGDAPNCSEAGVLGVVPGLVGMIQASEALKLILGIGEGLVGRLLWLDALSMRFRELALPRDAACPGCGRSHVFTGYSDMVALCSSG